MCPGCRSGRAPPRWTPGVGQGWQGPPPPPLPTAPPPASQQGQEAGLGAGGLQSGSEFHPQPNFVCNPMASPGCSEVPPWVPWRRGRSGAPGHSVRVSLWPEVSVLPPSSWAPGRAAPPERLLWSQRLVLLVLSAGSSPCVADRSFTKKARPELAGLSLVVKFVTQQGRALWEPSFSPLFPNAPPRPPHPAPSPWSLLL